MKFKILFIVFLTTSITSFSQENIKEDYSIKSQFDKIYRTSTNYQIYKVIGKDKYQKLKINVLDSLKNSKKLISEIANLLKSERENIQKLNSSLNKTKVDLETALQKENSFSLFGAQLNKITYGLILWFIIIALSLSLIFFIFKFLKNHLVTKEAQENLTYVEQEFENHRKKSIEREQKLRRQLQDEINKHRNA
jgi:tetrahydromethanopterin S-methyltransferase subunit B